MRFLTVLFLSLVVAGCSFGSHKSSEELATEYLTLAGYQGIINSTISGYEAQLSQTLKHEDKAKMHQILVDSMGWDATKKQLVEIVASTYSVEELEAGINYMNSPIGKSTIAKNDVFTKKYTELVGNNLKKALAKCCATPQQNQSQ